MTTVTHTHTHTGGQWAPHSDSPRGPSAGDITTRLPVSVCVCYREREGVWLCAKAPCNPQPQTNSVCVCVCVCRWVMVSHSGRLRCVCRSQRAKTRPRLSGLCVCVCRLMVNQRNRTTWVGTRMACYSGNKYVPIYQFGIFNNFSAVTEEDEVLKVQMRDRRDKNKQTEDVSFSPRLPLSLHRSLARGGRECVCEGVCVSVWYWSSPCHCHWPQGGLSSGDDRDRQPLAHRETRRGVIQFWVYFFFHYDYSVLYVLSEYLGREI